MKENRFVLLVLILSGNLTLGQTKVEIGAFLDEISEINNLKQIIASPKSRVLIGFGEKTLILLSEFFSDSTHTEVYSECHKRKLRKGEIAIIIADKVESMPYFKITNIQNCTLTFCDKNPNLIEYYFGVNRFLNNQSFEERYKKWLFSKERLNTVKGKARRERKKILNDWRISQN